MLEPISYTAVLDSCVLMPGFLSNFLLWLAEVELYRPKWTIDIHQEWIQARFEQYNIPTAVSQQRRAMMDQEFPHALVDGYEELIDGLDLPDANDRHVLAAAIRCGANAIVTTNVQDFPANILDNFNIVAVHQDDFVLDQLGLTLNTQRLVAIALIRHKKSLTQTRPTWLQYFEAMVRPGVGLQNTHAALTSDDFKNEIADSLRTGDWQAI